MTGIFFLIFFSQKMRKSLVSHEKPVKSNAKMINVVYLSEKVVVFVETKCLVSRNVNFELRYVKTDTSVSRQNTQKFSQSQSRSLR